MSDSIIEAQNISLSFGEKLILDNISISIAPEESVVFIGPSGSGKTVLLKLLAGIYQPTLGKVFIENEDWQSIESEHKHDLAKKLGMVFQQGALFDTLSALENVEFPLKEHFNYPQATVDEMAKELLAKVNLSDAWYKKPAELSGGMQRRLGIARAIALDPEITFYDDPTAGQDPIQSDQISNLILELKAKNKSTLLMTTSNMRVAYKMADRIFMVVNKEIIGGCSPEEFKKHPDPRIQQFISGNLEGPISIKAQ